MSAAYNWDVDVSVERWTSPSGVRPTHGLATGTTGGEQGSSVQHTLLANGANSRLGRTSTPEQKPNPQINSLRGLSFLSLVGSTPAPSVQPFQESRVP